MNKEKIIQLCKEISTENNISFYYMEDEFRQVIILKFRKDFKGYLFEISYLEINSIKNLDDLKYFLTNRLKKNNMID